MHTVAPIWRVAALLIPLASLVGCDWLPVRRRIDPALYPVPARPDPALIRGHRELSPGRTEAHPPPTALAGMPVDRPVPPLPDLVPVSPDELFGPPAPTPMLDAGLVRAQAIETAVFAGDANSPTESEPATAERETFEREDPFMGSIATDPAQPDDSGDTPPKTGPETVEVPPIPDTVPGDRDRSETIEPDSDLEISPATETSDPGQAVDTLEAVPEDQAVPSLEHPLEDAGEPIAGGEGNAEAMASREHFLRQKAGSLAQGQPDDPSLWQTVMHLLAESESGPDADLVSDDPAEGRPASFRIARIAFCREVLGFDQIKPVDAEGLEAGQKVLIYAEVEGVHYLPEANDHVSQLSTTLEILDDGDDRPLWSDVMPVEDRCSRPRHDYFVGYRLTLPESLTPGRYRLRVAQHDLLSGREDDAETPFVIVSDGD
jgi:hypothetical protein